MHGLQPLGATRQVLSGYARRGVFRSFNEDESETRILFRFQWLWNAAFTMAIDKQSGAIVFPRLFPAIERDVEAGIKEFLRECSSADRPEHRRLDPRQLAVSYSNPGRRGGGLRFRIKRGSPEDGIRKAVALVNEIFVGYLSIAHPAYLVEHYHAPED